jgi:restriction system protein
MAQGIVFEIELRHVGLNKYRHIRGRDRYVVEEKARAQEATWEEQWSKKQEVEARKAAREEAAEEKEEKKKLAQEQTEEASSILAVLERTLEHTLAVDDAIDWDSLKSTEGFPKGAQALEDQRPHVRIRAIGPRDCRQWRLGRVQSPLG